MSAVWEHREPYVKQPRDYVALFIRRRKLFILPAIAIFAGAVALAFLLPPVYRSTATVLIEEPEVPRDLVQSTVSSFATQRLQTIRQRVMTTENLTAIIKRYNLYVADRKTKPLITVIEKFREDLSLETISAKVVDPRQGRPVSATIAFQLAYDSSSPNVAQRIAKRRPGSRHWHRAGSRNRHRQRARR